MKGRKHEGMSPIIQITRNDAHGNPMILAISVVKVGIHDKPYDVCMLQDYTLHHELERAEISKKCLKAFFAMISHELRSPLQGLIGVFDSLIPLIQESQGKHKKELKAQFRMGTNITKLMMLLVSDILDLSQLGSGNFRVGSMSMNILSTIEESMNILMYKYEAKGVKLKFIQKGEIPVITSDKNRYMQILLNLLSNAIKFTSKGSVTIRVEYDPLNHMLKTEVQDTGIGIKEEEIKKLFKLFGKLESTMKENPQGTGLGLYICKTLSEAMGGGIRIESEHKKGFKAIFTIKNQQFSEESKLEDSTHSFISDCSDIHPIQVEQKKAALVVDDESICAIAIKTYLTSLNYDVDMVICLISEGAFRKGGDREGY